MAALIPSCVHLLLILVLLFPQFAQDLLMSRVPAGMRPQPDRFGMRPVPSAGIFVFGFALFRGRDRYLGQIAPHLFNPHEIELGIFAGVYLAAVGVSACLFSSTLKSGAVALIGKLPGAILLLVSADVLRRVG